MRKNLLDRERRRTRTPRGHLASNRQGKTEFQPLSRHSTQKEEIQKEASPFHNSRAPAQCSPPKLAVHPILAARLAVFQPVAHSRVSLCLSLSCDVRPTRTRASRHRTRVDQPRPPPPWPTAAVHEADLR